MYNWKCVFWIQSVSVDCSFLNSALSPQAFTPPPYFESYYAAPLSPSPAPTPTPFWCLFHFLSFSRSLPFSTCSPASSFFRLPLSVGVGGWGEGEDGGLGAWHLSFPPPPRSHQVRALIAALLFYYCFRAKDRHSEASGASSWVWRKEEVKALLVRKEFRRYRPLHVGDTSPLPLVLRPEMDVKERQKQNS